MKTNRGRAGGSAVVEGALILVVSLMVLIGILDLGSALFRLQGLSERARAGARYAVVNVYDSTAIRNVVVYGNSAGTGNPLMGLAPDMVSVTSVDLGDSITKIQVVISNYRVWFFTPFIAGSKLLPAIEVSLTAESQGAVG